MLPVVHRGSQPQHSLAKHERYRGSNIETDEPVFPLHLQLLLQHRDHALLLLPNCQNFFFGLDFSFSLPLLLLLFFL